jgi:prepilin-type N-terminal cleavage/methylation domain-containing protein
MKKIKKTSSAFTLIELLIVIAIIAILASFALPAFLGVQERAKQTKDLSNGKQVALALRQFALDNNGDFPNKIYGTGVITPGDYASSVSPLIVGSKSNDAFRWLLPIYLRSEQIFLVPGSAWNPNGADDIIDAAYGTVGAPGTLAAGECGYAYMSALTDTSESTMPLVADGWSATIPNYSTNKTLQGGVWGGTKAVVIFVDGSGQVMKVNDTVNTAILRPGRAYNLFDNGSSTATDPWFTAANIQLNPL